MVATKKKADVIKIDETPKTVVQTGTAAPGKSEAFRTNVQGERFDVNKPLASSEFEDRASFEQAKRIKQVGGDGGFLDTGERVAPGLLADRSREALPGEVAQEQTELPPNPLQMQVEAGGGLQPLEGRVERAAESGATAGLALPVAAGNLITSGIEQITGKKFGRTNAADLAETDAGQILGLSIAGTAAAALIGAGGAAVTGVVGGALTKVSVALGASKLVTAGAGLFLAKSVTGIDTEIIVDKMLDRQTAQDLQSAINTLGEISGSINGIVQSGGITPAKGLAEVSQLNDMLNIVENKIQQAVILDPKVEQSGQYISVMSDLFDQRKVLEESRADILFSNPQYNPDQITSLVEELQAIETGKREELVKQGKIRNVL